MSKRIISILLTLALLLSLALPVTAADSKAAAAAGTLNALGLFGGVGTNPDGTPNYDLDRAPSRQEAVTMLVRLLGREAEAKAGVWEMPFTDVDDWAKPYVGYAYSAGLTQGVSQTRFGGNDTVSAAQYLTFILRALGYVSGEDFTWNAAWELTDTLRITYGDYGANSAFTRGDVCIVSKSALQALPKGSDITLVETLVESGAVTADAAEACGLMPDVNMLFAREILSAEAEEFVLKVDSKGWAAETGWTSRFGRSFDVYSTQTQFTDTPAAEPSQREIASTVSRYFDECLDDDYTDYPSLWFPHMYEGRRSTYTWLITNGKGMVTGYAYSTGMESEDPSIKVRKINVDSKPLVEARRAEFDALISGMVKVPCDVTESRGKYTYNFSEIPENAVSVVDVSWNCTTNLNSAHGGVRSPRKVVQSFLSLDPAQTDIVYPVTAPVTIPAFYTFDESGYAIRYFVFVDADRSPVGYSTAILST
ncbi:MAG: S-layer homology domain-containing protein [Ruminococcaceae bacterium]|nr:S-layer homology domain-containing protein [Oscillospiraceae bacterium]